jgi:hypothetical protein
MRKFMAALAASFLLTLAACATGPTITNVTKLECTTGASVDDLLQAQQAKFPTYNIHIENVVTGEQAKKFLVDKGVTGDTIVVLGAMLEGKPSGSVLVVVSMGGCVQGQKFFNRDEAITAGLLPTQAS